MAFMALIPLIASIGTQAAAGETSRASTIEGAQAQAEIEGLGRKFSREQFRKEIQRQRPFLKEGRRALPDLVDAIRNKGDVSRLPATQIQRSVRNDFLGDQTPAFVKKRANQALNAIEAEKNKGRLQDLVSIGLGAAGSAGQSGVNLGTTIGSSLANVGNITAQSLQDAAIQRQNTINRSGESLSGLPAFFASLPQSQFQGTSVPSGQSMNQIPRNLSTF